MASSHNNTSIYKGGKIYKIVDVAYTEQYIGSTAVELSTRMAKHRAKYRDYKKTQKSFYTSFVLFDKYGIENCKIELIEHYPCESKEELKRREGHWIKNEICVNKCVAGRTDKEYREDNQDTIKQQKKEYRLAHLEREQQRSNDYRKSHRDECIAYNRNYYHQNKELLLQQQREYNTLHADDISKRQKKYRETHRDTIAETKHKYYNHNKEDILNKQKQYYEQHKEAILQRVRDYAEKNKTLLKNEVYNTEQNIKNKYKSKRVKSTFVLYAV
jgi:hypothetical protein